MLMGQYERKVTKNRIRLPGRFLTFLMSKDLVVFIGNNYLILAPYYKSYNYNFEGKKYKRYHKNLRVDKYGRIRLDKNLLEILHHPKRVTIIGMYDCIELWNEIDFENYISQPEDIKKDFENALKELGI